MSGDVDLVPLVEGKRSYLVMNEALLCVRSMEEEWACWSDMDFEVVAREMSGEDLHVAPGVSIVAA